MNINFKNIFLVTFLILTLCPASLPQSSSPYSRLGIGDIYYANSARKLGMGQLGVADAEEDFISFYNPAALYNLRRTRIEFNLNYHGLFLSGNDLSTYYGKADFGGFALAFPVSHRYGIGAAAGLVQFSNVGYNVRNLVQSVYGDYESLYEGKGGLSKLFVDASYKLPFDLIIGASLDYYFGNIDYSSTIIFPDGSNADASYTNEYRPKGVGSTIGIISPDLAGMIKIDGITNIRLGAVYNYISELRTDTVLNSHTTLGTDTVASGIVKMKVPGRLSAGLSFVLSQNYLVNLDYAFQPWKDYSFNGATFKNLRNASKISGGFEYKPQRTPGASFWQLIIWRAGLSYEQTQYLVNNEGVNEYSVSGGLSLPLSPANTLDFGLQYGMRGSNNAGLYKENILRFYLTVSLGDIWFIREEK